MSEIPVIVEARQLADMLFLLNAGAPFDTKDGQVLDAGRLNELCITSVVLKDTRTGQKAMATRKDSKWEWTR